MGYEIMEFTPQRFLNCIAKKEQLPVLVALLGNESYYRVNVLSALTEYVFADIEPQDREIHRFEQDMDLTELEQAINSYPFFGGKTMVVIADEKFFDTGKNGVSEAATKRLEKLTKILADIPDYCTVVLSLAKLDKRLKFYKNIKDKGAICACEPVKPGDLAPWLKERAAELGGEFDYSGIGQIMEYLLQVDAAPLGLLEKEIEKLAVVAGTKAPWTNVQVEQVFSDLPELGNYKLMDAVGKADLMSALKYLKLEALKSRPEPEKLIGGLRSKLKLMIRVLEYQRAGISFAKMVESFTDLKSAQYQLKMVVANLRNGFTMEKLVWAYQGLGEVNSAKRREGFSTEEAFNRIRDILAVLLSKNN